MKNRVIYTLVMLFFTTWAFASGFQDGGFSIEAVLGSFPMLVASTMWASNQIINVIHANGWIARVISWASAFILVALAYFVFKIEWIVAKESLIDVFWLALNVALVANGVHTIPQAKSSINAVSVKKKTVK